VKASTNGKRYLSVSEFARLTGLKPDTVRDQIEHGRLAAKRNRRGTRWLIPVREDSSSIKPE
jgi:excisionase family DNA binding protein